MPLKLITVEEAAELLQLPVPNVYRQIRSGLIPVGVCVRIGRQIRIRPDRLEQWLDAGGAALPGGWKANPEPTKGKKDNAQ